MSLRFIAVQIKRHSALAALSPRRLKVRKPSTCLIQPNTGSGMVLKVRIVGVEAAGSPGMKRSIEAGHAISLASIGPMIDGLVVRRVGDYTFSVVQHFVDDIVLIDERAIFDAIVWCMERLKLIVEGAAAAPIAALLQGLISLPPGERVGVLSGGNLDLTDLGARSWT
jgi:threonine dehydratase